MPILHLGGSLKLVTTTVYRSPADMPPQPGSQRDYTNDLRAWNPRRNYALVDPLLLEQRYSTVVDRPPIGSKKDYPNDLRTWLHSGTPNLLTFKVYSFPFDWQLAARLKPIEQTWLEPGNNLPPLPTILAIPPGKQIFDRPALGYRIDQTWIQGLLPESITKPPFSQYDWPLPRQYPRLDQVWLDAGNNFPPLPVIVTLPAGEQLFDRPVLQGPRDYSYLQTQVPPSVTVTYLPTPYDWQITYRLGTGLTWIQSPVPPAAVVNPFRQLNWLLPQRNPFFWPDFYQNNLVLLQPGVVFREPFTAIPWKYLQPTSQVFPSNVLLLTTPPVNPPINQNNWPLPGRYPRLDQTWVQRPFTITPAPIVVLLPVPFDWQITLPTYSGQTWLEAGNNFPPFPLVAQNPVAQYDWPNPRSYPRIDQTWVEAGNNFPPLPFVQLPLNQYDWPLPRTYPKKDQFVGQVVTQLLPPPVMPPFTYSFPNPSGYQRAATNSDISNQTVIYIPFTPPPPDTGVHFMPFIGSMGQMKAW